MDIDIALKCPKEHQLMFYNINLSTSNDYLNRFICDKCEKSYIGSSSVWPMWISFM